MQQWTRLKEDEADFDLTFALVVDAELFRLDSIVRWLDTADGRVKRAALELRRQSPDRSSGGGWSPGDELSRAAPGLEELRGPAPPRCTRSPPSTSPSSVARSSR